MRKPSTPAVRVDLGATQRPLQTPRLALRPFTPDDAATVRVLAGDRRVAEVTANIPHPYPNGAAEAWIASRRPAWDARTGATWAMTIAETGELVGAVGLVIDPESSRASIGYWVGLPCWGRGYARAPAHRPSRDHEARAVTDTVKRSRRGPACAGVPGLRSAAAVRPHRLAALIGEFKGRPAAACGAPVRHHRIAATGVSGGR